MRMIRVKVHEHSMLGEHIFFIITPLDNATTNYQLPVKLTVDFLLQCMTRYDIFARLIEHGLVPNLYNKLSMYVGLVIFPVSRTTSDRSH